MKLNALARCGFFRFGRENHGMRFAIPRGERGDAVLPVGDTAAELFYGKLFSLDPSIRSLFKEELREQGRNLTSMVSVAVGSLSRPQKITLAVQQLGRRHAAYGVEPRHYELVGTALVWMLEHVLGEAFTPEVRKAWTEVYSLIKALPAFRCAGGKHDP